MILSPSQFRRAGGFLLLILSAVAIVYFIFSDQAKHPDIAPLHANSANATVLAWPATLVRLAGAASAGNINGSSDLARFSDPYGIVYDQAGNLYVADGGDNNRIRKITPAGIVSTLAGSSEAYADGQGEAAAFHTPSGLAIDAAGNLYVADTGNHRIRKISALGVVTTVAGNGQAGYRDGAASQAQFNGPVGVAVDASGKVYVADTYNDKIRVINVDGEVTTLAGGDRPGYRDGIALEALFDTPSALVVSASAEVFVSDTRNNAIRKISALGQVTTLARSLPEDSDALMKRPLGLALTHDGVLYVGEASNGRLLQIDASGKLHGLSGIDIDIQSGDAFSARLQRPVAIAIKADGTLAVSDAAQFQVLSVQHKLAESEQVAAVQPAPATTKLATSKLASASTLSQSPSFPWPLKPQHQAHEIVGTIGEVRGNYKGESRDHFHSGVDIQAAMGAPVLAVASEKVSTVLPAWGYGSINEGMRIANMSYIHMRVGRQQDDSPIDPSRFIVTRGEPIPDDKDKLAANDQIRIKRGTRFQTGEVLGTVNRMYHVHLSYSQAGAALNPLTLGLSGFKDEVAPHIEQIQLLSQTGQILKKNKGDTRLRVARSLDKLSIIVDAYDQADGNAARRRLGLYKLGYQILHADGSPLPGFEQPQIKLEFNRLPPDEESVKIAYASDSGITVHGNASTRFLYKVTNIVRDGHASTAYWSIKDLPLGDYILRILAADYAGNQAMAGRDLAIRLE
ncbi:gluconolaconase [Undibacterium parvum]|uniref:Gluconolaconase n=1 Tax=Undibacterium parvum TaxID=401471 RepID=A0A3S9HMR2_9BURK|nr:gluconolaconase [Undibacterium parvum]